MMSFMAFQFTHPGRGATLEGTIFSPRTFVSIHAPREGCDEKALDNYKRLHPVSIHAPREGCDVSKSPISASIYSFQFTHPGRGAT